MVLANWINNNDTIWSSDGNGQFSLEIHNDSVNFAQFMNNMYVGAYLVAEAYSSDITERTKFWGHPDLYVNSVRLTVGSTDGNVLADFIIDNINAAYEKQVLLSCRLNTIDYEKIGFIKFEMMMSGPQDFIWNDLIPQVNNACLAIVSPMYFSLESLGLWLSWQQRLQFLNMYPLCFEDGYRTAVGKLTAQIGNIFNMSAILDELSETAKDNTIRWVLQVLTAYNVASTALDISSPLEAANREVTGIIAQLKGGQVSLQEPALHRDDEYNAEAEVITVKYQYMG